ncbi:MAG: methionine--tRNA ligase [bacterium]
MKKFYLTQAIAYTSGTPHIGNVYEAILADSIVRYNKFRGYDCYFQTGSDEHGQKIEEKAKEQNISTQEFTDKVSTKIKEIYDLVDVKYDRFIRTTDADHKKVVQDIFEKLFKQGDIYKGNYEGNYCKDCESFFTETQLKDKCCPDCGAKVTLEKEEAYFMKLSKYQDRLVKHIKDNPEFIQPESRKNEMLNNFLKDDIPDLCVSRSTFTWGIPVKFDTKHVTYVWIDALSNYISGLGFDINGKHGELYKKYWPADVHIIGKDILRFHTIYWPIILMALNEELPKQIFGHPWILFGENKMSKSKGNVLYTNELVDLYGVDRVRYYVLHEMPFAQDGTITHELIVERTNTDLANTLGNLVKRTITMQQKYFPKGIKNNKAETEFDKDLIEKCNNLKTKVDSLMDQVKVSDAIEEVIVVLRRANKYIDETAPWKLAAEENQKDVLENVLYNLLETIRITTAFIESFIPNTAQNIFKQLNTKNVSYKTLEFGKEKGYNTNDADILFNRLDIKDIQKKLEEEKEVQKVMENTITIDDFSKVEIVVGKVLESKKHENADKLLVSMVDIGTEERQIVSGIAAYYSPEEMVGKNVCVVTNLKEIEIRKTKSYGMILCAQDNNTLKLVEVYGLIPGAKVK